MLGRCAAVLSGYLGDPGVADVVARAVAAVRRARQALYLCDPVIGDDGPGVFVSPGVPEAIRERLLPLADIVLPSLRARPAHGAAGQIARGRARRRGASCAPAVRPGRRHWPGSARAAWRAGGAGGHGGGGLAGRDPPPLSIGGGTGDAFSALFLGHYLNAGELRAGLERAVAAMFALVERTCAAGAEELELVAAQDELVDPGRPFPRSASASTVAIRRIVPARHPGCHRRSGRLWTPSRLWSGPHPPPAVGNTCLRGTPARSR